VFLSEIQRFFRCVYCIKPIYERIPAYSFHTDAVARCSSRERARQLSVGSGCSNAHFFFSKIILARILRRGTSKAEETDLGAVKEVKAPRTRTQIQNYIYFQRMMSRYRRHSVPQSMPFRRTKKPKHRSDPQVQHRSRRVLIVA